ncbi:MAG: hypothetical protein LIO46_01765 [Clostridiales bacterium]|nr:hypothetical protein [Clostridiales bacterium]
MKRSMILIVVLAGTAALAGGGWLLAQPKAAEQPWLDDTPDTITAHNFKEELCLLDEAAWQELAPLLRAMEGRRVWRERELVTGGHYGLVLTYGEITYSYSFIEARTVERYGAEDENLQGTYRMEQDAYDQLLAYLTGLEYKWPPDPLPQ